MNIFIGTSGYAYPEWKGRFYPEKTPAKQFLSFYSSRFQTVEINSTFRTPPTAAVVEAWAEQVPAHFRFAIKAPQRITHIQRLKDVGEAVASLIEVTGVLKKRLGPILFQLPPNFKKDTERLRDFLALLPKGCRAAMEFRHPSWFDAGVFKLLRDHKTALCIADESDELKVPFEATANWGYLRLRRTVYNDAALKRWAKKIREQKWRDCFVYFKHEDTATGPDLASRLQELLS